MREFSIFCYNVLSRPHRENGKRARDDRKNKHGGATFLLSLFIVAKGAFFFLSQPKRAYAKEREECFKF